jgi:hypothetical protein
VENLLDGISVDSYVALLSPSSNDVLGDETVVEIVGVSWEGGVVTEERLVYIELPSGRCACQKGIESVAAEKRMNCCDAVFLVSL